MDPGSDRPERPTVLALADRLAALVGERRLAPGDRFLTCREAASHLAVRQQTANRALQILEHRGVLVRRQKVGAVVAEPRLSAPALRRVHLLIQDEGGVSDADEAAAVQVGLQAALPGCDVEIAAVPGADAARVVDAVVRRALRGEGPEGLVLARCGYTVQRRVMDSGLPAVLHGTAFAGIELSSLDEDPAQKGRLQAEALLQRGCRRILVVRRDRSLPGEVGFLRGLRTVAAQAGLRADAVDQLELAPHPPLVAAELAAALAADPATRTGVVATTRLLADAAWNALLTAGIDPVGDVPVISNRAGIGGSATAPFPHLRPTTSPTEQGRQLGVLLRQAAEEPGTAPVHPTVPCELVEP